MEYDHVIQNTSALDDAMRTSQERMRMAARSELNRTRSGVLLSGVPMALIAGAALVGAASAAAWIMRPHFDFKTIEITTPKIVEKEIEVSKPVDKPFDAYRPVDKPFELPVPVAKPFSPLAAPSGPSASAGGAGGGSGGGAGAGGAGAGGSTVAALPPKTPDKSERKFIERPDYKSADAKGRIVKSTDTGLHFDNGSVFWPLKSNAAGVERDAVGHVIPDPNYKVESDPFIGDYGYCNMTGPAKDVFACYAVHDDVVRQIKVARNPDAPCSSTSKEGLPILVPNCAPSSEAARPTETQLAERFSVPLASDGAGLHILVRLGPWTYDMVLDTGATIGAVSKSAAEKLVGEGEATWDGSDTFTLADGSQRDARRIVASHVEIGGHTIHDVEFSVNENGNGLMLFGLNALSRFGKFSVDHQQITFN
jgi:clan AA aspartic protease (TIGR02281 family)